VCCTSNNSKIWFPGNDLTEAECTAEVMHASFGAKIEVAAKTQYILLAHPRSKTDFCSSTNHTEGLAQSFQRNLLITL